MMPPRLTLTLFHIMYVNQILLTGLEYFGMAVATTPEAAKPITALQIIAKQWMTTAACAKPR